VTDVTERDPFRNPKNASEELNPTRRRRREAQHARGAYSRALGERWLALPGGGAQNASGVKPKDKVLGPPRRETARDYRNPVSSRCQVGMLLEE
jgi:hypothetical protein